MPQEIVMDGCIWIFLLSGSHTSEKTWLHLLITVPKSDDLKFKQ